MDERAKLEQAIQAAYDWLRDEEDAVVLTPSVVERLLHAARWRLKILDEEDGR